MKSKKSKLLLKPKYDVVFQSLFSDKNREETGFFISAILGKKIHIIKLNTKVYTCDSHKHKKVLNSSFVSTSFIFHLLLYIGNCFLFINLSSVTSYMNLITVL